MQTQQVTLVSTCCCSRLTSCRGCLLSLSPSILTLTTPDLSTISWMTLPFLPITLPRDTEQWKDEKVTDNDETQQSLMMICLARCLSITAKNRISGSVSQLHRIFVRSLHTNMVSWHLDRILNKLQEVSGLLYSFCCLKHDMKQLY